MTRSASRWRADRIVRMTASMAAALIAPGHNEPIGRRWLPMVFCVGLVALIVAPNLLDGLRSYDAGIASSAATFTLHGLLPYRDYWLLYGPLRVCSLRYRRRSSVPPWS